jgi:hypothetical protein
MAATPLAPVRAVFEAHVLDAAATLLEDALHGRSIRHRLDPAALRINDVLRSTPYRVLFACTVGVALALAFVEAPSSLRQPGPHNSAVASLAATSLAELVVASVVLADLALLRRLVGRRAFWRSRACLVKFAYVAVVLVCVPAHWAAPAYVPRLQRLLRPLLALVHYRNVSKIMTGMVTTAPKVAHTFVLLIVTVVLFAVAGHILFAGIDEHTCVGWMVAAANPAVGAWVATHSPPPIRPQVRDARDVVDEQRGADDVLERRGFAAVLLVRQVLHELLRHARHECCGCVGACVRSAAIDDVPCPRIRRARPFPSLVRSQRCGS